MKKIIIMVLIIAQVFVLCACGNSGNTGSLKSATAPKVSPMSTPIPAQNPTSTPSPAPTLAPTPTLEEMIKQDEIDIDHQNEVQGQSIFTFQDGWIYGQTFDNKGWYLFAKTNLDTGEWVDLDKGYARSIHVVGDYVYYMLDVRSENSEEDGIYRIRTNGEEREKLGNGLGSMQVKGNYIYYTDIRSSEFIALEEDSADACHLYRMNLNGENVEEILKKPVFHFYVFDELILYQDDFDGESLHICHIDGSNDKKLNNGISYSPIYDGSYIYYSKDDEKGNSIGIWRMELNGTDDRELCPLPTTECIAMYEDYIYFVNSADEGALYRVNKDGSDPTKVSMDKYISRIQFLDGMLKYTVFSNEYQTVKENAFSNPDGSDRWVFKK